uniref:Homeobox domain-containing protein n=1 Tax=Oryza punctata TaxID=4537 RepID=A0A0E0KHF8_ORYPU
MVASKQLHSQRCGGHCQLHHHHPEEIAGAESHRRDGSSGCGGAGPMVVLTLGSGAAAAEDDGCCCCAGAAPATIVSVLRDSRYLLPAQELLHEAVSAAAAASARGGDDEEAMGEAGDRARAEASFPHDGKSTGGGVQAKLLRLLSELESRHEHYFGELRRVSASFEPALGAAATAGYTALMAQAMSRHFGDLRRAILRKLRLHAAAARRSALLRLARDVVEDDEGDGDGEEEVVNRVVRRTKQAAAARAEQAWRPLRGLPEDSVAVLRAWLFDHFLHPYPNDNEKLMLAVATGLSRTQISNWFINARVRLWKPMVEEMYNDEFDDDDSAGGGGGSASSSS